MSTTNRPRVVIVGGGFGGLTAARRLRKAPVDVLLIDRHNYHLFQPLLYQVATAALSPADIASPIRRVLRNQPNTLVALGEVTRVDPVNQQVHYGDQVARYDYLILAAGATHSYFGNDSWEQDAPGLKTVDDALEIRRRVLKAFEEAEFASDATERRAKLTFVVVGGGPTGVEMAGALREIAANSIPDDFRNVDTASARIILVEGQERLLSSMSERSSARALEDLEAMGVEVRLNSFVTSVSEIGVDIGGETVPAENVIWAAGVRASPLADSLEVPRDKVGRVLVRKDCSLKRFPRIFVIGDMAAQVSADTGEPVPGVAQGALQMGEFVADVIDRAVRGANARGAFCYNDKGSLATIGKAKAVADIGDKFFGGTLAWLLWSLIHVMFLIGFRNRIVVMLSWAWNYVVHARGARLITGGARGSERQSSDRSISTTST